VELDLVSGNFMVVELDHVIDAVTRISREQIVCLEPLQESIGIGSHIRLSGGIDVECEVHRFFEGRELTREVSLNLTESLGDG